MTYSGKKMELLAPAGSLEVLKAVVDAGADSVYIGGKLFGMRQHAHWLNFEKKDMAEGIEYARDQNAKIYVTVNNLLSDTETREAKDYLLFLEDIAPDAILVQDLGLINLARGLDLRIPLHASTMMNVHNAHGASFLARNGITRIVCSRDISIREAADIRKDSGVEVEYFLHNDICISQGSLCYLSGMATEKSSNRGLCIKPCRWTYDLVDARTGKAFQDLSGKYFMAKKDICLYHQLPELISEGIDAAKIEGRARPAEYLVPIVKAYRKAIDRYYEEPYAYATDFEDFEKLHGNRVRDYTTNYAFKDTGPVACDHTGKREPRFFSLAAEEKGIDGALKQIFKKNRLDGKQNEPTVLAARCGSCRAARQALEAGADLVYVGGEFFDKKKQAPWTSAEMNKLAECARETKKQVGIATPRIMTKRELFEFERMLDLATGLEIRTVLASNLGALEFVQKNVSRHDGFQIVADFTFNIFNGQALKFLKRSGVRRATLSPELSFPHVANIVRQASLPVELLVHGSLFGMLVESCLISGLIGQTTKFDPCKGFCTRTDYALRDILGKDRLLAPDQYCRNHLLMEKDLCLLDVLDCVIGPQVEALRIEGQFYSEDVLAETVRFYRKYLDTVERMRKGEALEIEKDDWKRLAEIDPRELGYGAYVNETVDFAKPGDGLPTDEIILYKSEN